MESTFLSYSRRQYYFAESLALHLQQRGIPVWFDIQQLEPGVSWQADISDGLKDAGSVTLVASRAALASPYVNREWKHAVDHGKPVFVVITERVRLPPVLARSAFVVDFRSSFDQGVEGLLAQYRAPAHKRIRARLRPAFPAGVRRTAAALMMRDIRFVVTGTLYVLLIVLALSRGALPRLLLDQVPASITDRVPRIQSVPANASNLALIAAVILLLLPLARILRNLVQVLRFLRHSFSYPALIADFTKDMARGAKANKANLSVVYLQRLASGRNEPRPPTRIGTGTDWLDLLLLWSLSAIGWGLITFGDIQWPAPVTPDFGWPVLIGLLVAIILLPLTKQGTRRVMPHHPDPDVVRWAKPGSVPQEWREEVNRLLLPGWTAPEAQPGRTDAPAAPQMGQPLKGVEARTFRLMVSPGDEQQARVVKGVLSALGYDEVHGDAAYSVLILSYRTTRQLIRDAFRTAQGVIGILVTDIRVPRDLPELTALQWVDFRSGNTVQLQSALKFLGDDSEEARAKLSQDVMPVNLAPVGTNGELAFHYRLVVLALCASLTYALFGLPGFSEAARSLPVDFSAQPTFSPSVLGILALLILDALFLWYGTGMLKGIAFLGRKPLILAVTISIGLLGWIQYIDAPLNVHTPHPYIALGLIGLYIIAVGLLVIRIVQRPHLLIVPRSGALGAPSARPGWPQIGLMVGAAAFLFVSGLLTLCVVPVLMLFGLLWLVELPGRLRRGRWAASTG